MNIRGANVVVTGGAGFIGSWIVEKLVDSNRVLVLDRFSGGKMGNISDGAEVVKCDIRDYEKVYKALKNADFVFHLAANIEIQKSVEDPKMDADTNIGGTLNVLEASRKHGVKRVVFSSSSAVYGDACSGRLRENLCPQPLSPYAISKLAAETYAGIYTQLYGLETVSLRYFNVYGLRQNPESPYSGVLSIFAKKIKSTEELIIYGDGNQTRDFVNVKDVADANIRAALAKKASGRIINVGTGKSVSLNDIVVLLEKIKGQNIMVKHMPGRKGEVKHSCADISLARKILRFEPKVKLEDGLRELL